MLLRVFPLLSALMLWLASSSQAALFVAAPPAPTAAPSTPENASTAFLPNESESRIGLLAHNDPVNKVDPFGLEPEANEKIRVLLFSRAVPLGSNIPRLVPAGSVSLAKSAFNSLARGTIQDGNARTQSLFKDGSLSGISQPQQVRVFKNGDFVLTKTVENVDRGAAHGGVSLLLHFHDSKGTIGPTIPGEDADAMRAVGGAPMLFGSPALYARDRALIATPDGRQTIVDQVKDNP